MKSALSRFILITHRYLGVVIGTLMTIWCLSGFVMMYQGFPSTTETERLAAQPALDLSGPLRTDALPFSPTEVMDDFRIEMLNGTPVLRQRGRAGGTAFRLDTGEQVSPLSEAEVLGIATQFASANNQSSVSPVAERLSDRDQWTVQSFDPKQPIYKVSMQDDASTEVYVAGYSGAVIQDTNRQERILSWLGAIPHWLYPTVLREDGELWSQVVIWTSILGIFLTVTGLYVGVGRYIGPKKNGLSPYKGLWYWHHVLGLFLGIITLTWVFSGLMTMSPWDVLSSPRSTIREDVSGKTEWREVEDFIAQARTRGLPAGTRELRPAPLANRLHMLAYDHKGIPTRLNNQAQLAPLDLPEVQAATQSLPVADMALLKSNDAYYYGFKERRFEPAYRLKLSDAEGTLVYLNATTGQIARVADSNARTSRWLRNGMHSLDFLPQRPLWDGITLFLLAGVTLVCGTGAWMSFRRIGRDVKYFRRKLSK